MKNIVCLRWGNKYSHEYVNNLYKAVKANSEGVDFYCITDSFSKIVEGVNLIPIAETGMSLEGWWYKLTLFNPNYYQKIRGETLFLDLDIVILDDISPYLSLDRTGEVLAMRDPWFEEMNSSVMRWNRDDLGWVWERFQRCNKVGRPPQYYEVDGKVFQGDQNYLNYVLNDVQYFPESWTKGWKAHGKESVIDLNPKIVIFNGKPDPHELVEEVDWVRRFWVSPSSS